MMQKEINFNPMGVLLVIFCGCLSIMIWDQTGILPDINSIYIFSLGIIVTVIVLLIFKIMIAKETLVATFSIIGLVIAGYAIQSRQPTEGNKSSSQPKVKDYVNCDNCSKKMYDGQDAITLRTNPDKLFCSQYCADYWFASH